MKHSALSEFCNLNMGQSPDSSTYNNQGEGLPFYQGNADFGIIHPTTRVWCSSPVKRAHAEDILISVRAPIGAMNIAAEECCIGRGLAALTPKQDVCSQKYLYYALESRVDLLVSKGTGSTFKAISKKILEETELPAYPMQKQKEIVHVLETVDSLIGQRHTEAEYLDQLVKSRFIELFGTTQEFNRWPCCTIGDVAEICVGVVIKPTQYYTEKGVPAFRSLNIGEMKVKDNDWVYFTEEGHKKNQKSMVRTNDVLIVRSGAPGTACVATERYDGYNAIDIIIAHPDQGRVNSVFLAAFTNMPHGMNQIKGGTGGAAQQHFNVSGYKAMTLIMPPLKLQQQFAAFVAQVDKSKLAVQKSLQELQTLKKSLMQQYFG